MLLEEKQENCDSGRWCLRVISVVKILIRTSGIHICNVPW